MHRKPFKGGDATVSTFKHEHCLVRSQGRATRDWHQLEAQRRGQPFHRMAARQLAARFVHAEHDDVAAVLVRDQREIAARVELHVPWDQPAGRAVARQGQCPGVGVYREDRDAALAFRDSVRLRSAAASFQSSNF